MSRMRFGAGNTALVVLASLATGSFVTAQGCIPDVDTSGLPPYDASVSGEVDANGSVGDDAGSEASVTSEAGTSDGGGDGQATSASGTIRGMVVDYAQGAGRGVIPGATVAVVGGPTTTTDDFGVFQLTGVPSGPVLLNVSKATDTTTQHVAYSSTQVVLTLAPAGTAYVLPVLHHGCYELVSLGTAAGTVATTDTGAKCGTIPAGGAGLFASLSYGTSSFVTPSTGVNFNGLARIEIIPLGFPNNPQGTPDFTWALGLPGASAPVETLGAAEIRVIDDATGEPLAIRSGDTSVGVTLSTWTPAATTDSLFSYSAASGAWSIESGATVAAPSTRQGSQQTFNVATVANVSSLEWVGVTRASAATTCVTGTVTAGGSPLPDVWVHAVGANHFGSATAVTDANGAFCVDVKATGDGGAAPQIAVGAASLAGTAVQAALPTTAFTVSSVAGGSCANPTGCTVLSAPIALTSVNAECVTGTLTDNDSEPDGGVASPPAKVSVFLAVSGVSAQQASDGIASTAYIGTAPQAGGAFCAQVPAGTISLGDPNNPVCRTVSSFTATSASAAVCSSANTGCVAGGSSQFTCLAP